MVVRNLTGSVRSLGELRGNQGDLIEKIQLENIQVRSGGDLHTDAAGQLNCRNVEVNGKPWQPR